MDAKVQHPVDEVKRLQRCISDLISVLALPALWQGGDSAQIGRTLIEVLPRMLQLDLIYVQLKDLLGEVAVELVRLAESSDSATPREVGAQLNRLLGDDRQKWPLRIQGRLDDRNLAIVPMRIGLHGEIGMLVAAAERSDFPGQTEELLLRVAANQAVIALNEARLRNEQKRLTNELDQRVAQRTRELHQSELNLRNTQAELANMTRVMTMGQLTASIAHEVNQPLSGIITNASTCLRMLDANPPNIEGARETARRTIRDGNRAADIITRLRALFSRRQATTESIDLNEATREVIALMLSKLQGNRVILRLELADELPLVIGDRVQLQQVIMNLVQNSLDAMIDVCDRSRELLIRTQGDETDHVRLIVQDNGIGLDPLVADRIFDAFYTTKNGGMGIGLTVCRSIIESHQGRIGAKPNNGRGVTFSFSIPRSPESAGGDRLPSSAQKPAADQPEEVARSF